MYLILMKTKKIWFKWVRVRFGSASLSLRGKLSLGGSVHSTDFILFYLTRHLTVF